MFQTHHCELFCEGLCGDGHVRALRQMLVGGGAIWIIFMVISLRSHCRFAVLLFLAVSSSSLALANCDFTTFSDGCLGSINDEGRSEVR